MCVGAFIHRDFASFLIPQPLNFNRLTTYYVLSSNHYRVMCDIWTSDSTLALLTTRRAKLVRWLQLQVTVRFSSLKSVRLHPLSVQFPRPSVDMIICVYRDVGGFQMPLQRKCSYHLLWSSMRHMPLYSYLTHSVHSRTKINQNNIEHNTSYSSGVPEPVQQIWWLPDQNFLDRLMYCIQGA